MNDKYFNVLKNFSEQLKTQSYDGNTERIPTYWMVQKKERIWNIDPYEADGVLIGFSDETKFTVEEFKEVLKEKIKEDFEDPQVIDDYCREVDEMKDFDDIVSFCEDMQSYHGFGYDWDVEVLGYKVEWRDVKNEMFLTKRDAKEYIRKFDYRFTEEEKPLRTYAYVAEDSPDLTALIDALKNIDWNSVSIGSTDDISEARTCLVKIFPSIGDVFYIQIPVPDIDDNDRIEEYIDYWFTNNAFNIDKFELVDGVQKCEHSYELLMHPGKDNEFKIFMPRDFDGRTDDAIYEWVSDYFSSTNYTVLTKQEDL